MAHPELGEKLLQLVFANWNPASVHEERNVEVQALYLSALRAAMGGNPQLLCYSLADKILPGLCQAADAEAQSSAASGVPWPASRLLFETLAALLPVGAPVADTTHPSIAMWRQAWPYLEKAMLQHDVDVASDQPVKAASQALRRAALHAPALFVEVLQLLAKSASERDAPEVQLQAIREIVVGVPCPPVDPARAAEVLDAAIATAADALMQRPQALAESPDDLAAFFGLLAEAVRPSATGGAGPCDDRLRPLIVGRPVLIGRLLNLVAVALPECRSDSASQHMLRFVTRLMSTEEAQPAVFNEMLVSALPSLCAAICGALASQDFLAEPEALAVAGDLLLNTAQALPEHLPAALASGLSQVQLPDHSKVLLQQHVNSRGEWSQKGHWLEQLQQIVVEWHSERHLNVR